MGKSDESSVKDWNRKYRIGTPVRYLEAAPGAEGGGRRAVGESRTASGAYLVASGKIGMVKLEGVATPWRIRWVEALSGGATLEGNKAQGSRIKEASPQAEADGAAGDLFAGKGNARQQSVFSIDDSADAEQYSKKLQEVAVLAENCVRFRSAMADWIGQGLALLCEAKDAPALESSIRSLPLLECERSEMLDAMSFILEGDVPPGPAVGRFHIGG